MDLANLKPTSDTVEVTLVHPNTFEPLTNDDDGSEMTITLYAPHSKEYKRIQHEQTNRHLKKVQKNKGKIDFTSEELEASDIEVLSKATVDWNITFGEEKPKLTYEKAKEVYEEVFWIRDQVKEGFEEALNFTTG